MGLDLGHFWPDLDYIWGFWPGFGPFRKVRVQIWAIFGLFLGLSALDLGHFCLIWPISDDFRPGFGPFLVISGDFGAGFGLFLA